MFGFSTICRNKTHFTTATPCDPVSSYLCFYCPFFVCTTPFLPHLGREQLSVPSVRCSEVCPVQGWTESSRLLAAAMAPSSKKAVQETKSQRALNARRGRWSQQNSQNRTQDGESGPDSQVRGRLCALAVSSPLVVLFSKWHLYSLSSVYI